ncbi:LysR family transcriptional regulator [Massilia genomosp. 1]|uniref:LysR family transcriptional regulator n=1 Tax=Massilia genomosp. 1 TaxID=2609280 RepID=A0ABX0MR47_9BURK|nr:LysR family transcriptional regulator [Massilia genomosp. 1]NHZ64542.1 LysR family transcriptional regulator [Massilia genomosp. 1]
MESLTGIISFVRTAETLSFVAAGRALGVSASAVGKNVAALEQALGVRLLHRSTRVVKLTVEGTLFYERCRRILDDLHDAKDMLSHAAQTPRGKLRASLPTIGYRFLMPFLPAFSLRYPDIEIELDFSDRLVDIIEKGFDVVIRSGELPDSRLISRQLGPFRFVLCAAPAYLAENGVPQSPEDLERHQCIRFRYPTTGKVEEWSLSRDGVKLDIGVPNRLICNNMEAVHAAVLSGYGIAYMPDFLAAEAIKHRTLLTLLDDFIVAGGQFWAVWPSSRHLSPRVRAFVDYLGEMMGPAED